MFANPRTRTLAILGAIALVFAIAASVALMQRDADLAAKYDPHILFPDLKNEIAGVTTISVQTRDTTFDIKKDGERWIVPSKMNFPADPGVVRATLNGMAELEAAMPKTQRAEWMRLLDLGAPEDQGNATRLVLSDASGKALATILVGKTDPSTDAQGRPAVYVRKPDETIVWLARGFLTARRDLRDWLDKSVLSIPRERVRETRVQPIEGQAYTVRRDTKESPTFSLVDLPAGRALSYDSAPDGVATAIVGFVYDDVADASAKDFSKASVITTKTFDGLSITLTMAGAESDAEHWATIGAATDKPEAEAEAAAINERVRNWAFLLPAYKSSVILTSRDSLLRPLAGETVQPRTSVPGVP